MMTKVYGASDDLLEFEGEFSGEVDCHAEEEDERGALVVLSDGTLLEVKYGKDGEGIWSLKLLKSGKLFERIDQCDDADAKIYSDVAHFKAGIKWAYVAKEWERVK